MPAAHPIALPAHDPALEALGGAWSPAGALELFNRVVLPLAWPGRAALAVTVEGLTYSPGQQCAVLYALSFPDGAPAQRAVATFAKDDRLAEVFAQHYGGGHDRVTGDPARPVVLLPERRCLVEFFGMDWKLPALARATDPAAMAGILSPLGFADATKVEVLRYRPRQRCVLRYAPAAPGPGARAVIGKVYRRPDQGERVWRVTSVLWPAALELGLTIPAPLALVDETLLLMECLDGRLLKEAFADIPLGDAAERIVRPAAAALAAFHALSPAESVEPRTFASEVATLRTRLARVSRAAPLLAQQSRVLLDRLAGDPAGAGAARSTLVHGDFKPSQLLIGPHGTAVLDLDRAGPGDPAVDVGNFMAQFHKEALGGAGEWLRELAEPFLAEYTRLATGDEVAARARLCRTLALVRMSTRRFLHAPHLYALQGASSSSARLLAEAASCLD